MAVCFLEQLHNLTFSRQHGSFQFLHILTTLFLASIFLITAIVCVKQYHLCFWFSLSWWLIMSSIVSWSISHLCILFGCCSVMKSCPTLFYPMDCSMPGFPVLHYLPEFAQTHGHWVGDAIQPSHPLFSPSPPVFDLSQHQGLFQCISSSHQVAKVLELQLQHQSFQWIFRTDFL